MTHWDLPRSPWDKGPRYHPPGQHPATARMQVQLRELEKLEAEMRDRGMDHTDATWAANHIRDELAKFEEVESERKAEDYFRLANRPR